MADHTSPEMPPRSTGKTTLGVVGSSFLTRIGLHEDRLQPGVHPFTLPILAHGLSLDLTAPVTFFVGENGSGKSSLLEALAWSTGFGMHGGSRDHRFEADTEGHALGRALALGWRQRSVDAHTAKRSSRCSNIDSKMGSTSSMSQRRRFRRSVNSPSFGLCITSRPNASRSSSSRLTLPYF